MVPAVRRQRFHGLGEAQNIQVTTSVPILGMLIQRIAFPQTGRVEGVECLDRPKLVGRHLLEEACGDLPGIHTGDASRNCRRRVDPHLARR